MERLSLKLASLRQCPVLSQALRLEWTTSLSITERGQNLHSGYQVHREVFRHRCHPPKVLVALVRKIKSAWVLELEECND
jgi:hypothetical protein